MQSEEDLKEFVKGAQKNNRYYGINFRNLGTSINTIEFRLANGTIDADIWIENINLFGGIIRASEELAIIQSKPEQERTPEEKEKLVCLEKLKNVGITDVQKLETLLKLVIPKEDREVYMSRYKVNNVLVNQNSEIEQGIIKQIAKTPIDLKKIGKKIFLGENQITGTDYRSVCNDIERDLQIEDSITM